MDVLRPKSCQKPNEIPLYRRGPRKTGFSLVEVLVSIVVLGIGVIGAAGMQLGAMRSNQHAAYHTHALQLAAEMADAVRARAKQSDDTALFLHLDYRSADGAPETPAKLCYAIACDAEEFAAFELYEWKRRVQTALPSGRVLICRDSMPWNSASNALSWDCNGGSDSDVPVAIKLGWQAKNPDGSLARHAGAQFPPVVALTVSTVSR